MGKQASWKSAQPKQTNPRGSIHPGSVAGAGRQAAPTGREQQAGAQVAAKEDSYGSARPSGDPSAWTS